MISIFFAPKNIHHPQCNGRLRVEDGLLFCRSLTYSHGAPNPNLIRSRVKCSLLFWWWYPPPICGWIPENVENYWESSRVVLLTHPLALVRPLKLPAFLYSLDPGDPFPLFVVSRTPCFFHFALEDCGLHTLFRSGFLGQQFFFTSVSVFACWIR